VELQFEENLCAWGNHMQVNFAPLNADWGLAHLVINSVCFAHSVLLTMYEHKTTLTAALPDHCDTFFMYWMWRFHLPGGGLLDAFQRMLSEQKCITFALVALVILNQPQSVFYSNSLYNYEGQLAQLILYCTSIAAFLTFWLVIIDVMSKQNPLFSTFSSGFWVYKSLFFVCFVTAHLLRLLNVLGFSREQTGAQNSQSSPDVFDKLGGYYFVCSTFFISSACVFYLVYAVMLLLHGHNLGRLVGQDRHEVQLKAQSSALPFHSLSSG
jgi:hypothetical protein